MTKIDKVREALLNGETLTTITCREKFGTTELRNYVSRFKREGLNICSRWVTKNNEHFKEYFYKKNVDFSNINFAEIKNKV